MMSKLPDQNLSQITYFQKATAINFLLFLYIAIKFTIKNLIFKGVFKLNKAKRMKNNKF